MSDDAEITLRCVMNFIHGYGPTFNIDERVQPFTHPLWFLLISALTLLLRNVFAATFGLSIVLSLATFWLLMKRLAASPWPGMLAGAGLLMSKAFVDYSTSGLENPLSSFLLVVGLMFGFRCLESKDDYRSAAVCLTVLMLSYLSRPDLVLLVLPFCLLVLWTYYRTPREAARLVTIAVAPEVLWTMFSLFYYGAPFPNTAYAKLGLGIPITESIRQGLLYLVDSLSRDPITLTFTTLGILLALRKSPSMKAIATGVILYLSYTVYIGGDFMTGRFLTLPLLASAVILVRSRLSKTETVIIALVFAATGVVSAPATVLSGPKYSDPQLAPTGISDERGYCFPGRGLATTTRDFFAQPNWPRTDGISTIAVECGMLGAGALYAGPVAHYIDPCALTDPLLARLPPKYDPNWRIGHFVRQIPSGYEQSILRNENLLADPAIRDYWEAIRRATRGPLFSLQRLKGIARLNLGLVTKPDFEAYRSGRVAPFVVDLASLSHPVEGVDIPWYGPSTVLFETSIEVRLPSPMTISSIDISLDHNDKYLIEYQSHGTYTRMAEFGPTDRSGMIRYQLKLDRPTAPADRIRISVTEGDMQYAVGHLFLNR